MHSLLARQLRKHLPPELAARPELASFLAAVSASYDELQDSQELSRHTLQVVSDELTEANRRLRAESETRVAVLSRYYRETLELQQGMILCVRREADEFVHTLCSGRLAARLGLGPETVIGRTAAEVFPAAAARDLEAAYAAAQAGEERHVEFASADGSLVCLAHLSPRQENGRVAEIIVSGVDVTELKRTQAEAEKLALVAARTDNAVVLTDAEGRIEWVNTGFTRITGYALAEVRGRRPGSFLQGPETDPATMRLMHDRVARGEGFSVEILNYGKSGRKYWLSIEVQPVRDAAGRLTPFMAIERDITGSRHAQESLRVQFELARALARARSLSEARPAILDAIGRGMGWTVGLLWSVAAGGQALVCTDHWPDTSLAADFATGSRAFRLERGEGLPGRAWSEAEVQTCHNLAAADQCPRARLALAQGLRGGVALPFHAGGGVLGVAEFFSKTAREFDEAARRTFQALAAQIGQFYERNLAEQALRARGEELVRANAALDRASRLKDAFLASVSHELRTPLNAVLGLSESLLERLHGPLTEKQDRYLAQIHESGQHLLDLINDILDLAKIEAGQQALDRTVFPLAELCEAALALVAPIAQRRRQSLESELPPASLQLDADPRRLKQILVNLLGNAAKFTPTGGRLGLRVAHDADWLRLEVWDKGIGIAPKHLGRLFTPFQQLDSGLDRDYSGTGLGLSLVKQLTLLHGGTVEVHSRPGEGSTFTVLLPARLLVGTAPAAEAPPRAPASPAVLASPERAATSPTPSPPPATPPPPVAPLILIADDLPSNVLALRDWLEANGFRVVHAANGREALRMASELRPDLIVMDIQMPELDGIAATRVLRASADPELARTPVLALTALAMERDRATCLAAGMNDYLPKPASPRELLAKIRQYLPARA